MADLVRKHASIREDQQEYLEETALNFSKFVRMKLDQRMEEDGFETEG